jgi:pSer/pThr/pTyr-binding forkhead associated (FHA) protein
MSFYLKVLASPEGEEPGRKYSLSEGDNLAGRITPPCTISLLGTKVSKKHCVFRVAGRKVVVEDLKSSNGIFVNGRQVSSAELKVKDRLVVGEYTLELGEG